MPVTLQRCWDSLKRRMTHTLHPRAIKWRYLKRNAPDQAVITRLGRNLRVRVYPHDVIGEGIYVQGCSETSTWKFVERFLQPGMVFFDLGANLGQYSLLGATRVGPTGSVHSFEPSERMHAELQFNVGLNDLHCICRLNRAAVSDTAGTARLSKYAPGGEVYASLGTQQWARNARVIGHEEVRTVTLDKYVSEHGIGRVDLIKMDIEGAELLALRGACHLLQGPCSPTIVFEIADVNTEGFGYRAADIVNYLKERGYSVCHLRENGSIGGAIDETIAHFHGENLIAVKVQPAEEPVAIGLP